MSALTTDDFIAVAEVSAVIVQIIAIIVAIRAINASVVSAKNSKIADVVMHCSMRYDDLSKNKSELSKIGLNKKEIYLPLRLHYRRFWGLKNDQFDYWISGLLDHDTFYDWSYNLTTKFIDDLVHKSDNRYLSPVLTLTESWKEWRQSKNHNNAGGSNPAFESYTEKLRKIAIRYHEDPTSVSVPVSVLNEIRSLEKQFRRWRNKVSHASVSFHTFYYELIKHISEREKIIQK